MELRLGQHVFDVSTQALVAAQTTAQSPLTIAQEQVSAGAAAIFVTGSGDELVSAVELHAAELSTPVIVQAETSDLASRCLRAGASAIDGGVLGDPGLLLTIADANASVLIVHREWARSAPRTPTAGHDQTADLDLVLERARWAEAVGLAKSQIIVETPFDQVVDVAAHGYPVAISTADPDETAQGVHVAAVMNGARLIRSDTVRPTKRTVSTVSELLQRRGTAAPAAVEFVGSN